MKHEEDDKKKIALINASNNFWIDLNKSTMKGSVDEDSEDDKVAKTLVKKGFIDEDGKSKVTENKPVEDTAKHWIDLNELSPAEKLKLWMEEPANKHLYVMYKIYFPFVLGVQGESYIDHEGEVKEKSFSRPVDAIDLNSSPSLPTENYGAEEVVNMMHQIYFPSVFW